MPCSPGMVACVATCLHRALVEDYRAERRRQEDAAEAASLGYATEWAEYTAANPLVTFGAWLKFTAVPPELREAA